MSILRVMLVVLMIGAGAIALYGLLVDTSPARLPLVVSGLAVGGIAAGIFGFSLAGSAVRLGQSGCGGRAIARGVSRRTLRPRAPPERCPAPSSWAS